MAKTAFLVLLDAPKLNSRKICLIEKSSNFHTVSDKIMFWQKLREINVPFTGFEVFKISWNIESPSGSFFTFVGGSKNIVLT